MGLPEAIQVQERSSSSGAVHEFRLGGPHEAMQAKPVTRPLREITDRNIHSRIQRATDLVWARVARHRSSVGTSSTPPIQCGHKKRHRSSVGTRSTPQRVQASGPPAKDEGCSADWAGQRQDMSLYTDFLQNLISFCSPAAEGAPHEDCKTGLL
eukprot:359108-Chlamydomonas_euryale.AAC.5